MARDILFSLQDPSNVGRESLDCVFHNPQKALALCTKDDRGRVAPDVKVVTVAFAAFLGASRRLGCVLRLDRDRCFALSQRSSFQGEEWTTGQYPKTAFWRG
jgi:hypothetical protein